MSVQPGYWVWRVDSTYRRGRMHQRVVEMEMLVGSAKLWRQVASKVVSKTSTYPNKWNVAYATIRCTDPETRAGDIELGTDFACVCIDETILDNEVLGKLKFLIGDAFS
ncbi:unnamed protein product [Triticum turgidum subsp. durum]|uniref:Uncharacterized protein n=1 Tax=Triticum turgidum subsp. durum TaxID=4567 RepID=A0A9R0XZS3_TRITD|nr:unnamed protein product [Triticum turgidum subsp. durum]